MKSPIRLAGLLIASLSFVGFAKSQSTLHCMIDESWLPVYEVKGKTPYCFTGDDLVKGSSAEMTMLSSSSFGEGFIDVRIIHNQRSGVVRQDTGLKFLSDAGWFQFTAKVRADRDIDDLYYAMRFDAFGRPSYYCESIGSLKAGQVKVFTIFRRVDYEMPEQLHFFSGTDELRSSLIQGSYSYSDGGFMEIAQR